MYHQPIPTAQRAGTVALAELVAAFSYALDMTEGQPAGHCVRACWIGYHIGQAARLDQDQLNDLYYTMLLKDLGCSSNAARICELYAADDRAFKQGYKTVGNNLAATLHFVFSRTARSASFGTRAAAVGNILRNGDRIAQELIVSRCTRGADIARSLRFPQTVCDGIYSLDEHWDGSGRPAGSRGHAIPLLARIALLAQVIEVFHAHAGRNAAIDEVRRRSGRWFDPELVQAFESVARDDQYWRMLTHPLLESQVVSLAPRASEQMVDDDYLDSIAAAFGEVIDAKSPYTAGHSTRVADITMGMSDQFGIAGNRLRWLRRGALLHDIGKLGVSNTILDKPARLTDQEWVSMRDHAVHTRAILGKIGAFEDLADVAAAHHERLDGTGYPLGLSDQQIPLETRIITVSDFFDALTADRPYRAAMPVEAALNIMRAEVGKAIDPEVFDALQASVT